MQIEDAPMSYFNSPSISVYSVERDGCHRGLSGSRSASFDASYCSSDRRGGLWRSSCVSAFFGPRTGSVTGHNGGRMSMEMASSLFVVSLCGCSSR